MDEWKIEKRYKQIMINGKISPETIKTLFEEYSKDILNNIPREESEARTLLILANAPLVTYVLNHKLDNKYYDQNSDEYSIGKIGLIKAIDTYKQELGNKFSSYAVQVILREIWMYYRSAISKKNEGELDKLSLEECLVADTRDEISASYVSALSSPAEFVEDVANKDSFNYYIKFFKYLTPEEQACVIHTYGLFDMKILKQREIAEMLNFSRANASRLTMSAIEKLRILSANDNQLTGEQKIKKYGLLRKIYTLHPSIYEYYNQMTY